MFLLNWDAFETGGREPLVVGAASEPAAEAARRQLGTGAHLVTFSDAEGLLDALIRGDIDLAVLPEADAAHLDVVLGPLVVDDEHLVLAGVPARVR